MRSNSCGVALVLIAALALAPLSGGAQSGDAAVAYQINVRHTGATQTPGFKLPITVKWAVNLGNTISNSLLIAEGKVFVIVEDPVSTGNHLYALNSQTGQIVWGPVAVAGVATGICYENGRLFYVPLSNATVNGGLMDAFDAATGRSLWRTKLPVQYSFTSSPTALNGIVYTAGDGVGSTLYAVRETDGVVVWTAATDGADDSSPAVTDEGVYVSYWGPQTYKFHPKTGRLLWYYDGAGFGGGGSTPVLYEGQVYIEALDESAYNNNNGMILNTKTGAPTGFFDPGYAYFQFTPAFAGSTGFFMQGDTMTAQSVNTGATLWSVTSQPQLELTTPPLVVNGIVFAGEGLYFYDVPATVYGWNARTGAKAVAQDLGRYGDYVQAMSAAEGMLIVVVGNSVVALGNGIGVTSLTLNPATATATVPVQGTVTLNGLAPKGGLILHLASKNAAASVPATITVEGGKKRATFTVTTTNVSQATTGTIQATLGLSTVSALLTVDPIGVSGLILDPTVVYHGGTSRATVTLGAPAPTGGITVYLASSNPPIAQAASSALTIPAGATTGQMTIYTASVLAQDTVIIRASTSAGFQSALLTLEP